ncbi:MAG: BTAD domain-containing putative transcriptional regulator [Oscillospiraceae bacterium]|jgi:DNA-binding SARP family transcriptional activator
MGASDKLNIIMFGGCSITYKASTIGDNGDNSSKLWNLLAYLITYRNREISRSELMKILWEDDEKAQNPIGALKTLVHRARKAFGELGLDGKRLILNRKGSYCLNCDEIEICVDTETFEALCQNAEKKEFDQSTLPDLLQAAELYKGDFLPNLSSETWVMPLSVYYNNKYISIVHNALNILSSQGRYEEVIELSRKAISIAPYDETLNMQLIDALRRLGRYQLALNHYHQVTEVLYQQFAITPSEELNALYKEIIKQTNLEETCISEISDKIKNGAQERGAYYCPAQVFQEICRYDARTKIRNGRVAYLCLITVRAENNEGNDKSLVNNAVKELHAAIRDSLRCGDCFSLLSASQFGILLQDTTYEIGRMVLMRVIRAFHRRFPKKSIKLDYSLKQLDPFRIDENNPDGCAQ